MPKFTLCLPFLLLTACLILAAQDAAPVPPDAPPMSPETRLLVIRSLSAEFVFARRALPFNLPGVVIRDGQIVSPTPAELDRMAASRGTATKPGDRVQITNVLIKDDKILCEINGGPRKKGKWYDHVQVGVGGAQSRQRDDNANKNPLGTVIELAFAGRVPEMTGNQVRLLLSPLFDFNAKSAAEAYIDAVPPKVKEAMKNHEVLVGMNREMVTYSKGRPDKRIRERDAQGQPFEEWLYGEPPGEVQFVRFVGDEVVRLVIMRVDGQKVVRTDPEMDVKKTVAIEPLPPPAPQPAKVPSLRRPGERPLYDPARDNSDELPPLLPPRETAPASPPPSN